MEEQVISEFIKDNEVSTNAVSLTNEIYFDRMGKRKPRPWDTETINWWRTEYITDTEYKGDNVSATNLMVTINKKGYEDKECETRYIFIYCNSLSEEARRDIGGIIIDDFFPMRRIGTSQHYCLIYTGNEDVESYVWIYAFEESGALCEIGIPVVNAKKEYSEEEIVDFCLYPPEKTA